MAPNAEAKLVRVKVPLKYGAFHAERPEGPDVEYKGGDIADVTPRQARAYGLEPLTEDEVRGVTKATPSIKQDVPK